MRAEPSGTKAWLVVRPEERDGLLRRERLDPVRLADLPGEIVSGHPDRHVRRMEWPDGRVVFLKREHRVPWRERWKNRLDGFGWASKSRREAEFLARLEAVAPGVGPRWIAYGADGRGCEFLLLAEADGTPCAGAGRIDAAGLGRWVARLHHAGIDQPDLLFKHLFVRGPGAFMAIDWQRARFRGRVGRTARYKTLAALHATAPEDSVGRLRFLAAYADEARSLGDDPAAPREIAERVARLAARSRHRARSAREGGDPPRFVWLDGEAVVVVPDWADRLRTAGVMAALHDPDREPPDWGDGVRLSRERFGWPPSRVIAALRGRNWRSRSLLASRSLARRDGPAAPRLLAFGQRLTRTGGTAFLLTEGPPPEGMT